MTSGTAVDASDGIEEQVAAARGLRREARGFGDLCAARIDAIEARHIRDHRIEIRTR